MQANLAEILEYVDTSSIKLVRFLYCDTASIIRGKATSVHALRERMHSRIGLVKGMMSKK